jgi:carboxylesterase
VLLIHGFTGSPGHMRPLGEALAAEGYTVLGVRLSGHGTRITDMDAFRWNDWLRDVRDGFHRLAARCDEIYAAGLSMGGVLTLILAQEQPLSAAVSICAPVRLTNRWAMLSGAVGLFVRIRQETPEPGRPLSPYDVGYRDTPMRCVPSLLRLMSMAERGMSRVTCPLLIVRSGLDATVRADSAQILYDGATRCAHKRILELPRSRHVCTIEPEFDALFAAVSEHFREAVAQ